MIHNLRDLLEHPSSWLQHMRVAGSEQQSVDRIIGDPRASRAADIFRILRCRIDTWAFGPSQTVVLTCFLGERLQKKTHVFQCMFGRGVSTSAQNDNKNTRNMFAFVKNQQFPLYFHAFCICSLAAGQSVWQRLACLNLASIWRTTLYLRFGLSFK